MVLIGKEKCMPGWTQSDLWGDFGGRRELHDRNVEETAAREADEELMGVIHPRYVLYRRLRDNDGVLWSGEIERSQRAYTNVYRMYVLSVPYLDYDSFFQRFRAFLECRKIAFVTAEKTALEWIRLDRLWDYTLHRRARSPPPPLALRRDFAQSVRHIVASFPGGVDEIERTWLPRTK